MDQIRQVIVITYTPDPDNYANSGIAEGETATIYEMAAHDKVLLKSNELLLGDFDDENIQIEWSVVHNG